MKLFIDFINAKDFIEKLIPNFWSFLIQLLSLIVLIIVVIFVAYKPVKKILQKRQDYIVNNIRESEEAKAKAIIQEREARELASFDEEKRAKIEQYIIEGMDYQQARSFYEDTYENDWYYEPEE